MAAGLYASWVDASRRAEPTATQLWMVPADTGTELRVGVTRYGANEEALRLVVEEGSAREEYPVQLEPMETFETTWPLDGGGSVVRAVLFLGDSTTPFREVFHRPDT